ncbi:hypothetical protein BKA08_003819 [Nocardioides marinisabuli]|uniref:Uncharacterized protein n=1 Tax=Nocardioides marinisabuli TaxID=419476 RepID=A0A7Y9F565_9ACTN|nr:hypothetical protein [Nocardioides marinisabuli]NYD59581.1 hypothetical protein [Nocardioides marinisabuli]
MALKRSKKSAEVAEQDTTTAAAAPAKRGRGGTSTAVVRAKVATALWAVFVLLAMVLAVGALLIAIDANRDNGLVSFVLDLADGVDLGVFSRENGIREFDGSNAETKNALFNWGLGAVAYLVVGRLVERVVKP